MNHEPNDARLIAKRDQIQRLIDDISQPAHGIFLRDWRWDKVELSALAWLHLRLDELRMKLVQVEVHRLNEALRRKNFQLNALRASERAARERTQDAERAMIEMMDAPPDRRHLESLRAVSRFCVFGASAPAFFALTLWLRGNPTDEIAMALVMGGLFVLVGVWLWLECRAVEGEASTTGEG